MGWSPWVQVRKVQAAYGAFRMSTAELIARQNIFHEATTASAFQRIMDAGAVIGQQLYDLKIELLHYLGLRQDTDNSE